MNQNIELMGNSKLHPHDSHRLQRHKDILLYFSKVYQNTKVFFLYVIFLEKATIDKRKSSVEIKNIISKNNDNDVNEYYSLLKEKESIYRSTNQVNAIIE